LGVVHKISGLDTGGSFSVVEHPMEPGTLGALPHTHANEDEYSLVLEGEVGVLIGEDEYRATPGTYVLKPRGGTTHVLESGTAASEVPGDHLSGGL